MSKTESTDDDVELEEQKPKFPKGDFGETTTVLDLDFYDTVSDDVYQSEPIVGERVQSSIVSLDTPLTDALEKAAVDVGLTEYVVLEHGAVDQVSTSRVKLDTDTFEEIIEWYVNQKEDMMFVTSDQGVTDRSSPSDCEVTEND